MFTDAVAPTLIAEGTQVQGSVTFLSSTFVAGLVEGNLEQQSLEPLQIGKTGWVKGSIVSQGPVVVEGRVDGSVSSHTRIRLSPTAQVKGGLAAPAIQIQPGAMLDGEVTMGRVVETAELQARHAA